MVASGSESESESGLLVSIEAGGVEVVVQSGCIVPVVVGGVAVGVAGENGKVDECSVGFDAGCISRWERVVD